MKRNQVIKLLVLAGAVVSTWAITTSILAHSKQEHPPELTPVEITSSKKIVDPTEIAKSAKSLPISPKANPQNSQLMKRFSASAQGKILNVEAEVELNDQRRDRFYVWTLYVLKASDDSPQLVHVYDNQVFTIPESNTLSPTFQERTELPAGDYKVFLTLSRLPKDADLTPLKDPKILKLPVSLRGFATVKID